jgi:hypothetical protein
LTYTSPIKIITIILFEGGYKMSFKKLLATMVIGLGLTVGQSSAATLNFNGLGQLTGADDVDVGGTSYDVAFVDSTCDSIFGPCLSSAFDFNSFGEANTASLALIEQVFKDVRVSITDIFGCGNTRDCAAITPFGVDLLAVGEELLFAAAEYHYDERLRVESFGASGGKMFPNFDLSSFQHLVFADWTASSVAPPPSPVPLPAGGMLIVSALAGLGMIGRRKKIATKT